jgi:hypothetical protein
MMLQPFHALQGFTHHRRTGHPLKMTRKMPRFTTANMPRFTTRRPFTRTEHHFSPRHFALGTAIGAGMAYFLDPERGKRRRIIARDRTAATLRQVGRQLGRHGRKITSDLRGQWVRFTHDRRKGREPTDLRPLDRVPDFHGAEFRSTTPGELFDFQGRRAA